MLNIVLEEKKMTDKEPSLWAKFMAIHYLLPFGNGGRGTKVYLFPFVGVAVIALAAPLINFAIYGNF